MSGRLTLLSAFCVLSGIVLYVLVVQHGISQMPDCRPSARHLRVELPTSRYPQVLALIRRAKATGSPIVLRKLTHGAVRRRRSGEVFAGMSGRDVFQYPPAIGRTTSSAEVARVPWRERGATRLISKRLQSECQGQSFVIVGV